MDENYLKYLVATCCGKNRGNSAGHQSGTFDLGSMYHPKKIGPNNSLEMIIDIISVLEESPQQSDDYYGYSIYLHPSIVGMIKRCDCKSAYVDNIVGGAIGIIMNAKLYKSDVLNYDGNISYCIAMRNLDLKELSPHDVAVAVLEPDHEDVWNRDCSEIDD